jgi:hypothetical protein
MADRIQSVRLKIERAKEHITQLERAISEFRDSHPYTLVPKQKPEIEHTALCVGEVLPVPGRISTIIGDTVHNLRSSLDYLAWQLIEAGGGTPGRGTYFPISESVEKYTSAIAKGTIKGMPTGACKLVEAGQRYVTGDDTLWHIHELDRSDKHRLLITATTSLNQWGVSTMGTRLFWDEEPFILEPGHVIVNMPTSTYGKQYNRFQLWVDVAFGQTEVEGCKPVLETLHQMADFVNAFIGTFEPFLS